MPHHTLNTKSLRSHRIWILLLVNLLWHVHRWLCRCCVWNGCLHSLHGCSPSNLLSSSYGPWWRSIAHRFLWSLRWLWHVWWRLLMHLLRIALMHNWMGWHTTWYLLLWHYWRSHWWLNSGCRHGSHSPSNSLSLMHSLLQLLLTQFILDMATEWHHTFSFQTMLCMVAT